MTHTRRALVIAAGLLCFWCARVALGNEVYLRGGAVRLGTVTAVDDAGVSFEAATGEIEVISWDRVRLVTGPFAEEAAAYAGIADTAWRGRYRLERGDASLAQPLFETLYQRYRGQTSETALTVSEGVLRCRLQAGAARGDIIEPYLETLRLRRAGIEPRAYRDLEPVIDERTELLRALPPLLIFDAEALPLRLAESGDATDAVMQALAELYECAVARATHDADRPTPSLRVEHAGVELLHMMLSATGPNGAARNEARRRLTSSRATASEDWLRAWHHAAIGASLVLQSDEESRMQGVLELLHVPILYSRLLPELAAGAALEAARTLDELQHHDQADRVRFDFRGLATSRHLLTIRDLITSRDREGAVKNQPRDHLRGSLETNESLTAREDAVAHSEISSSHSSRSGAGTTSSTASHPASKE